MIRKYFCEACGDGISRKTFFVTPYCIRCQCAHNIVIFGAERGWILNKPLMDRYGLFKEEIQKKMKLPYWNDKKGIDSINN